MKTNSFYIDTCIYLNLWKKEGNESKGKPYWKIAKEFFEKYDHEIIYYSGFILKEMKYILNKDKFDEKRKFFQTKPNFKKVLISETDLIEVRKIEIETKFMISFFDLIHMILSKKSNSILITRDKELLQISKAYNIAAKKPEELL